MAASFDGLFVHASSSVTNILTDKIYRTPSYNWTRVLFVNDIHVVKHSIRLEELLVTQHIAVNEHMPRWKRRSP